MTADTAILVAISKNLERIADNLDRITKQFNWYKPHAVKLMEDLDERGSLRKCKTCDRDFSSSDGRTAYCSPKCRYTMQKRKYRAKKLNQLEEKQA